MMTDTQVDTLRSSFNALARRGDELSTRFFTNLFSGQPALRSLLPRSAQERDRELLAWLGMVVKNVHRVESISFLLEDAGSRAQRAGLQPQQFGYARDALIDAMRDTAANAEPGQIDWTPDLESDWTAALNVIVSVMIRGAGRARARAA